MAKPLTQKQVEIVRLLAEGFTTIEIAQKMENSIKTIDAQKALIFAKMDAKNVANLIHLAHLKNLI